MQLTYSEYKSILPIARSICGEILNLNLDNLETIIWIDNWIQKNVQYIKNKETVALGKRYICSQIDCQATVPDVLLRHYGVCEDIAVSIATILSILGINNKVIQGKY